MEQITKIPDFKILEGVLYFKDRLCVPNVEELKNEVVTEAHHS